MNQRSDDAVMRPISQSRTFGAAERLRLLLLAGLTTSRAAGTWRAVGSWWASLSWAEQRGQMGVLLLVAVAIHVVMLLATGTYSSWMVFIIPVTVALVSAAAVMTSLPWVKRSRR